MKTRTFTLSEAQATLPQIQAHMEEAQAARREILRIRPDALPAIQKAAFNGGNKLLGEMALLAMRLETHVKAIQALGVILKDLDAGLVDFLAARNVREIYLCWRYGEERLGFWHELNAGFSGRQPIDESIR